MKNFVYESLIDLDNENEIIKNIAIEKANCWEFFLSSELLKSRLIEINRSYLELEKGLVFHKSKSFDLSGFCNWYTNSSTDFLRLVSIIKLTFEVELINSYGAPGFAGNIYEIKSAIDKITSICKELLAWEYELQGVIPPQELKEISELMKGWTKIIIDEINKFPLLIEKSFSPENLEKEKEINLTLTFPAPPNIKRIIKIINDVTLYIRNGIS